MSLAINVQSSVTKRFYQEVAIRDKQSIWRSEFRCAAAQKLRSVCKRALKVRLHVRSCDWEVCLFYYVQIAIGDFYYAQLCAKLCVCARAVRSALRRNRSRSDLRFQLRVNAD